MQLSLVLPAYNEAANIKETVKNVISWFNLEGIEGEIVVVNDGSTDGTAGVLKELEEQYRRVKVITHPKNRGYGAAVTTGLNAGTKEWLAYMDSDGQFKAEDFNKLLPFTGEYKFITGRRRKRADPFIRRINAKLFAILNLLILRIWVRDINCAVKMWKREIWPIIKPRVATGALINAEMFFRLRKAGIKRKQVFVEHYPRRFGTQTGANLGVIIRMFKEMWTLRWKVFKGE